MAVMDYRTRDGLVTYGFSIEPHSGAGWRVYIMSYLRFKVTSSLISPTKPLMTRGATM